MTQERSYWEVIMLELSKTPVHAEIVTFYKSYVEKKKEARILDLGAGNGLVSMSLAGFPQVTRVTAYDKSSESMRDLKETEKIEKVTTGSHTQLPFEEKTFDIVICRFAFHHFDERGKALKEVGRVLKNDGIFLLSDPILPEYSKGILNGIYRIREDSFYGYCGYHELIELLENYGFLPMQIRPYHVRYPSLRKYLEAVENGVDTRAFPEDATAVVPILKSKIARAWNAVDEKVKSEMKIEGNGLDLSFQYDVVDIASRKGNA